ncbi:MAG: hypothetical protein P9L95_05275 [Candidatus Tenebribacter mawsonii]|nr:hypothetical protein [Candidatus Tenebribacter mawsonii]
MNIGLLVILNSFIGVIIGASVSIITTLISSKNELRVKELSDSFARKEKARSFQKENVIAEVMYIDVARR